MLASRDQFGDCYPEDIETLSESIDYGHVTGCPTPPDRMSISMNNGGVPRRETGARAYGDVHTRHINHPG